MALKNAGIEHEVVAIAEIDKYAIKSYEAIHGEVNNLGDISQIDTNDIPDHDLFTYSFPCQDISVAGQGLGLDEGSGTRSGLLWECQKVIAVKKPKYLLLENVKNLVGKKHKENFDKWLEWLEEQGYTNYWDVLNAKDFGVAQNRERVFVVSILGEHVPYVFPEKQTLTTRLKDVLEPEVEEKFYLSDDKAEKLIATIDKKNMGKYNTDTEKIFNVGNVNPSGKGMNGSVYDSEGLAPTVTTNKGEGSKILKDNNELSPKRLVGIFDSEKTRHQAGAIWDKETISPTLDTMQGGWRQPSVLIGASRGRNLENPSDRTVGSPTEQRLEINKQGTSNTITTVQKDNYVLEGGKGVLEMPKLNKIGNIYPSGGQNGNIYGVDGMSPTISSGSTSTKGNGGIGSNNAPKIFNSFRIRKLTPKECWRLMGFSDDDFHKAEKVNSNTQLYKQAGNSIVVNVLEAIFKELF